MVRQGESTEETDWQPVESRSVSENIPVEPSKPRRPLIEILLDPRSIQALLGLGGALMIVGLVILLWLNNFFTPMVTAIGMAIGSVLMLVAGLGLILKTRYQMAGKAVALLACAVMPLNLWYLHSNTLITIDGHLWLAALLICGLYAAAAWTLKDEVFVYVFTGGITLTGLLILADLNPSPQRFWEIASPSTLLVILGLIGIHLERAFVPGDGPSVAKSSGWHSLVGPCANGRWVDSALRCASLR